MDLAALRLGHRKGRTHRHAVHGAEGAVATARVLALLETPAAANGPRRLGRLGRRRGQLGAVTQFFSLPRARQTIRVQIHAHPARPTTQGLTTTSP